MRHVPNIIVGSWLLGGCGFNSSGGTAGTNETETGSLSKGSDPDGGSSGAASTSGASVSSGSTADASADAGSEGTEGASDTRDDGDDPCAGGGGCDPDASCATADGGGVCMCNEGFVGDGETCDLAPLLETLRWELPCTDEGDPYCATGMSSADATVFIGEPGTTYAAMVRLRGVVELASYTGGEADGYWRVGGDPVPFDDWNATLLEISEPHQIYRYNNGTSGGMSCVPIDFVQAVQLSAGATVALSTSGGNALSVSNYEDLVIPDIDPAPAAFDGQFVQLDAVTIVAL